MNHSGMDLAQLVKAGAGQPYQLRLNLAQVITEHEFNIAGRVFAVWDAPSSVEYILVRFNRRDADQIRFERRKILAVPFTKLYITVPAGQTGNFDILYGPDAFEVLRIYTNPPENDAVLTDILNRLTSIRDEQQGPQAEDGFNQIVVGLAAVQILTSNADRHDFIIQAPSTNGANIIYLGFDNTVTSTKWFAELPAGAAWACDDWRGDVYAIASLAAQDVNYGEW